MRKLSGERAVLCSCASGKPWLHPSQQRQGSQIKCTDLWPSNEDRDHFNLMSAVHSESVYIPSVAPRDIRLAGLTLTSPVRVKARRFEMFDFVTLISLPAALMSL